MDGATWGLIGGLVGNGGPNGQARAWDWRRTGADV
jgi:hypothetical protein